MGKKLTNQDFCRAAKKLKCEVAAIKAVDDTESKGAGFYANGFPVILFERHKFRKYTGGRFNASHPAISGPAGGYGAPGQNQQNKFNLAFSLDSEAAMKSCSWGRYQVMGFNYDICGFPTVSAFVDAMKESEGRQLDAFVSFVIHEHLADELRTHDWSGFAQGYNGADYKINKYDTKMATAYKRLSKENIDCGGTTMSIQPETQPQSPESPAIDPSQPVGETPMPESLTPKPTDVVEVEQVSAEKQPEDTITRVQNRFLAIPAAILSGIGAAVTWATSAPLNLVLALLGIGGFILVLYIIINAIRNAGKEKREAEATKIREAQAFELQKLTLESAMSKDLNTVRIVPTPIQNSEENKV